jgi:hypothetical protein
MLPDGVRLSPPGLLPLLCRLGEELGVDGRLYW